jgi:predicted small metal-binding protein
VQPHAQIRGAPTASLPELLIMASPYLDSKGKSMKTMTCQQLGGKCDQKLSASSWDEMVKVMTKHVMEKHPDVAKQMEKMHNQDPKRWAAETKPKWDAAAEA